MELTRRDALVSVAAVSGGVGGWSALVGQSRQDAADTGKPSPDSIPELDGSFGPQELETMVAIAQVIFPSDVTGIDTFVRTYLDRRARDRPAHAAGITQAVAHLNRLARDWHGGQFTTLGPETQDRFLREVGADTAAADPAGTTAQRVRYYLINELLFALYASPLGGELVGLENPQGHPGGLESYRRGPRR